MKPSFEPVVVARKPLSGTVAGNVLQWGTGALNIEGCRVGAGDDRASGGPTGKRVDAAAGYMGSWSDAGDGRNRPTGGRWPANVVLSESQAAELDRQSGNRPGFSTQRDLKVGEDDGLIYGKGLGVVAPGVREGFNDSGGASRFFHVIRESSPDLPFFPIPEFPTFVYEAKAPTHERPRVQRPDGTWEAHPTCKPLGLMRLLVRLVTPPGGVVLEPFAGSGTTCEAAVIEGFRCIAIEREESYLPLIVARLSKPIQPDLFGGAA